jgi:cysteine desulfurase
LACSCKFRKRIIESDFYFDPKKTIYLDYNATTPVDPRVLGAFESACRNMWGNPSSLHIAGTSAWEKLDAFRTNISDYFKCTKDEIHFCSSGSEAIHAMICGMLMRNKKMQLVTSNIEHSAVTNLARHLRFQGRKVVFLKVDENGKIDMNELEEKIKGTESLVVISPVNHETGGTQNVQEIYKVVKSHESFLFLDAVQAAGRMPPEKWSPFCDAFAVSGHKIYSPKGTAFFWIKKGIRLSIFRAGGHQENGMFPGTENIPGIASFSSAVDIMKKEFTQEEQRLKILSSEGLNILTKNFPEIILESPEDRVPGVLSISLPWVNNMEEYIFHLNKNNICLSRFSACSGRITGPSNILLAMNRPMERASNSLRISFGRWSKRDDFFYLVNAMKSFKN